MVDNFSWEIDFSRDLRKGDKFVLAWDGEKTPCAMIYLGDRKTIALFAYKSPAGQKKYYTSEGKTLNDSFSFPPLKKYTRISSGYQKSRYHPTLKVWRSHSRNRLCCTKRYARLRHSKRRCQILGYIDWLRQCSLLKTWNRVSHCLCSLGGLQKRLKVWR